jgi:putative serine/threonine protein kinase
MLPTSSFQQNGLSHGNIDTTSPQLANIISYPQFDNTGYIERINEIQALGVKFIVCGGRSVIGNVAIAGKGCVSLVLRAKSQKNDMCALKIRRLDANRSNMEREVELNKIANSVGVGPEIFGHSKNIILMEFVEGLSIIDWITHDDNAADPKIVLDILLDILEQCYLLDTIHLDHGQLSYLDRHVIISNSHKVTLIDFESSSTRRRTSNVTCAAQSLLLSGFISRRISDVLFLQNKKERLIEKLQLYKSCQTRASFDELLYSLLA